MTEYYRKKSKADGTLGIYIHVPFCRSKCPYCDFFSEVLKNDMNEQPRTEAFVDRILKEIEETSGELRSREVDTIYFGGGTPNLLQTEQIERILKAVGEIFCLKDDREITMEVNPGTLNSEKLKELRRTGINRLSIGAQSFDDGVLRKLGRIHRAADIMETYSSARDAGFGNISLDLMFGIEGQSFEVWMESVRRAAELRPEHISLYSLEFMEGTRFTRMLEAGKMHETDPEEDRKMYHAALELFREAGYVQYEISNLSLVRKECGKPEEKNSGKPEKEDYRSRHNVKYWKMDEYLGFGPSAHSFTGGRRYEYTGRGREMYEELSLKDEMSEWTFTGLRMNEGINTDEFRERFGVEFREVFRDSMDELDRFVRGGFAEIEDRKIIRLTTAGFDISNRIMSLFV